MALPNEALALFIDLILEWNERVNLTGFRTREEIESILIGESVAAASVLDLPGKEVLDFGSGAGIPGLVWEICEPRCRITSLEVRLKKVAFQKQVTRQLGLKARIIAGHFPEAVQGESFDLIVTRAIRFSPSLWQDARMLLREQGSLVRFAGRNALEEGWQSIVISERSSLLIWQAP